jgi:hypothetical protein
MRVRKREEGLRVTDTGADYQLSIRRRYRDNVLEDLDPNLISLGGSNFNILNREWFSYLSVEFRIISEGLQHTSFPGDSGFTSDCLSSAISKTRSVMDLLFLQLTLWF